MNIGFICFEWYDKYHLTKDEFISFGQIHYYTNEGDKITTHNFDNLTRKEFNQIVEFYKKVNDDVKIRYDDFMEEC